MILNNSPIIEFCGSFGAADKPSDTADNDKHEEAMTEGTGSD